MYSKIINPKDNKSYSIFSKKGQDLLKKYVRLLRGGRYLGKGTYKCVMTPPIRCKDENDRYSEEGIDSSNFVSSVMKKQNAKDTPF